MERTLSIVKPDGVSKNLIGKVIDRFESNGIVITSYSIHYTKLYELCESCGSELPRQGISLPYDGYSYRRRSSALQFKASSPK